MRFVFYFMFFFSTISLYGQEMYWERPAKLITELHFKQLNGGVIPLKARFNNISDTFNFILDTGSGGISLDSTTTALYSIPHKPSGRYIYGIAGVRKVDFAPNNSLSFPGLKVDSLDFYINDYEVLTSVYGVKIDGIIGYSFLKRYLVKVDFDSSTVSVFHPGYIRYPPHGILLHPDFRGLPVVPLSIKDSKMVTTNFFFDTGAGLCFLISKQLKEDSSLLLKRRKPATIEVQGFGGKRRMKLTLMKEVQIGSFRFRKVPTYILDDENNILAYPSGGGLIGDDLLRRFNMIINYPQKEIHLLPNSHFRDPFDYSYTGMTMYSFGGEVVIDDIVKGSPADNSGLKNGDVIMSISNNFSGDLEEYKNLLQKTVGKVDVLILRNGSPKFITLKIGRIH